MPPKNYQGRSLDFAHDEPTPHQIGPDTLKLTMLLVRVFYTDDVFRNLTDCAWDNFTTIIDRMPSVVVDIEEYVNDVLDWAFASCGRLAYDRVKEICDRYMFPIRQQLTSTITNISE